MSFLKKLGQVLVAGTKIVTPWGSLLDAILPSKAAAITSTVIHDLPSITAIVAQVEAIGAVLKPDGTATLTGPQKLAASAPLIGQILLSSQMLTGHKIADPALFQKACTEFGQAACDLLNSLDADGVKTANIPS